MYNYIPNFRFYREKSGLTHEQLAYLLEVTPSTVANYENGRTTPSMDMVIRMAHVLGITTDQLLNFTPPL